jgi:hypothetical protein
MSTRNSIPADLAKAFESVVAAADIWYAVGRELHVLPKGLSITRVSRLAASFIDDMPEEVRSLLMALASWLNVPPPADKSYQAGAKCLDDIRRALKSLLPGSESDGTQSVAGKASRSDMSYRRTSSP